MPGSCVLLHNIERRPLLPSVATELINQFTGTQYTVYNDRICAVYKDGIEKVWWNKPSMQNALRTRFDNAGNLFNFYQDGSVEARYGNHSYYWSAPIPTVEEVCVPNECGLSKQFAVLGLS